MLRHARLDYRGTAGGRVRHLYDRAHLGPQGRVEDGSKSGEPEELGHDDARKGADHARAVFLVAQDKPVGRAEHCQTGPPVQEHVHPEPKHGSKELGGARTKHREAHREGDQRRAARARSSSAAATSLNLATPDGGHTNALAQLFLDIWNTRFSAGRAAGVEKADGSAGGGRRGPVAAGGHLCEYGAVVDVRALVHRALRHKPSVAQHRVVAHRAGAAQQLDVRGLGEGRRVPVTHGHRSQREAERPDRGVGVEPLGGDKVLNGLEVPVLVAVYDVSERVRRHPLRRHLHPVVELWQVRAPRAELVPRWEHNLREKRAVRRPWVHGHVRLVSVAWASVEDEPQDPHAALFVELL